MKTLVRTLLALGLVSAPLASQAQVSHDYVNFVSPAAGAAVTPAWSASAAAGSYMHGTLVTNAGTVWLSLADNNATTPGATGATWQSLGAAGHTFLATASPISSGSASAYAFTTATAPAGANYVALDRYLFQVDVANAASPTVNVNGYGAVPIDKASSTGLVALAAGDLIAGQMVELEYDASNSVFQVISRMASAGSSGVSSAPFVKFCGDSNTNQSCNIPAFTATNASVAFNGITINTTGITAGYSCSGQWAYVSGTNYNAVATCVDSSTAGSLFLYRSSQKALGSESWSTIKTNAAGSETIPGSLNVGTTASVGGTLTAGNLKSGFAVISLTTTTVIPVNVKHVYINLPNNATAYTLTMGTAAEGQPLTVEFVQPASGSYTGTLTLPAGLKVITASQIGTATNTVYRWELEYSANSNGNTGWYPISNLITYTSQ